MEFHTANIKSSQTMDHFMDAQTEYMKARTAEVLQFVNDSKNSEKMYT